METIVIIVLLIVAIIAILAALVIIWGRFREIETSYHERRLKIEQQYDTALFREAKAIIMGNVAYITKGVSRESKKIEITYEKILVDATGTPIVANVIDNEQAQKHRLAVQLLNDSIEKNTRQGTQLLTAAQWEGMGHNRDSHGLALEYLSVLGLIRIAQGGRGQGTFVKTGTLQTMLMDMALNPLPQRLNSDTKKS